MRAFEFSVRRKTLFVALAAFAQASCNGSLLSVTAGADAGADATAAPVPVDAGLSATPDATLEDGELLDAAFDVSAAEATAETSTSSDVDAGPEILSLLENVSSITQGGSFTVTAVVTDPQGLLSLTGGGLTSASGAAIGAFTSSTPGTYSLTVSWAQLNAAAAINFTGQTTLTNRATFYDAQGRQASQDVAIEVYCGSAAAPNAACAGQCVDLTSVETCGSCAVSCADAGGGALDASCAAPLQCAWVVLTTAASGTETCTAACANGGGTCIGTQVSTLYGSSAIPATCSTGPLSDGGTIEDTADVTSIGCNCDLEGDVVSKTQTGDCTSICASLPGSPPCYGTAVWVAGGYGVPQEVFDTCRAPYSLVAGTVWDNLVQADLPANETVASPPIWLNCQCEGAAP